MTKYFMFTYIYSLHHHVQTGSGPTQPSIQWVSSAEIKNAQRYTFTTLIHLHGMVLSEAWGQLCFNHCGVVYPTWLMYVSGPANRT